MSRPTHTDATCKLCNTYFDHLPVEYDEDGGYAVLEVTPCAACGAPLCPCCSRFQCSGCGETYCASHLVIVPDGTPRPLHCCLACAAECEPALPMPIRPELRPAIALVAKGVA